MPSAPELPPAERADVQRAPAACASLLIDPAAGVALSANADGWRLLGLDEIPHGPVALDCAMPALQRLRDLACRSEAREPRCETLTIWTRHGALRLRCSVRARDPGNAGSAFLLDVPLEALTGVLAASKSPMPADAGSGPEEARSRELRAKLAHELRTPLSAIVAYAEILKSELFGPLGDPRYRDYAGNIFESAKHAVNVADSMLQGHSNPAAAPQLVFTDVDPQIVVQRCIAVAQPLAEQAGLVLAAHYAPRLPRVVADEMSIKQILLNLLSNAIKFAHRGDRVTVAVGCNRDGLLDISVSDTGPGIDATRPRAAEGKPRTVGLGLGLPLTKALAEANGATLAIASMVGLGTRVTVSFAKDRLVPV
jgi:two-component system, cell cycle sensor histidine kinase PleC